MSAKNLLDAVRVVKENERIASASYADAAQKINNPLGKNLFLELSKFEQYHYDQLTRLEVSLEKKGGYINYEGKDFPIPPTFEISAAKEPNSKSIMTIITSAIDLEKKSEKAYAELALKTSDETGYKMFRKLSEEEHKHYELLIDAYWTLTNLGTWKWTQP